MAQVVTDHLWFLIFPGKHKISVVYDHQEIIDSPFYTDVKIPRIYVKDLEPVATLGKRHRFNG